MSKGDNVKIWTSDEFHSIKLSALSGDDDNIDEEYLVLGVWETSEETERQVFIRVDNLKLVNVDDNTLQLQLSREDESRMDELENSIVAMCKRFVTDVGGLRGLKYDSFISENDNGYLLNLSKSNIDNDPKYYLSVGDDVSTGDVSDMVGLECKIIMELYSVHFDLTNKVILPEFRLRQLLTTKPTLRMKLKRFARSVPERVVLPENSFSESDVVAVAQSKTVDVSQALLEETEFNRPNEGDDEEDNEEDKNNEDSSEDEPVDIVDDDNSEDSGEEDGEEDDNESDNSDSIDVDYESDEEENEEENEDEEYSPSSHSDSDRDAPGLINMMSQFVAAAMESSEDDIEISEVTEDKPKEPEKRPSKKSAKKESVKKTRGRKRTSK